MKKVVDPVLDFFIQIPLAEGNILRFLAHNNFQASTVQIPTGETKNILFYYTQYPKKTVQFQEAHNGIENFLYTYQKTFFMVLDEFEMTFLMRTPTEEHGVAISIQNEQELYPVRTVHYSGEKENTDPTRITDITLQKHEKYLFGQKELQKFFMSFIEQKKLMNLEDLNNKRLHGEIEANKPKKDVEWL